MTCSCEHEKQLEENWHEPRQVIDSAAPSLYLVLETRLLLTVHASEWMSMLIGVFGYYTSESSEKMAERELFPTAWDLRATS